MKKAPLAIRLLVHPDSESAMAVAEALLKRFMEPPGSGGLRIPVFYAPDLSNGLPPDLNDCSHFDIDAAVHTIVVILADSRMTRTVGPGAVGQEWADFTDALIKRTKIGKIQHHVMPVALDEEAFQLSANLHILPASLDPSAPESHERQVADISYELAARAFELLDKGCIDVGDNERVATPITLFISHAKADLQTADNPVKATAAELVPLVGSQWLDSANIITGEKFEKAIHDGIAGSSIVIAFHTDHYSDRPWCRREIIIAKELGLQILIVEALDDMSPRVFPYLGNAPLVRWRKRDPKTSARRILDRAVRETLLFKHNKAVMERFKKKGDVVLGAAPEALTLAFQEETSKEPVTFLYPEPPLGNEELEVLSNLRPSVRFVTPLLRIADSYKMEPETSIAISISPSDDSHRYGFSPRHQATLSDEVCLYLLAAGLRIAYGGLLDGDFSKRMNFTQRMFDLAKAHSSLFRNTGRNPDLAPIINFPPWPAATAYGEKEWRLFGKIAELRETPVPELPEKWTIDELFPKRTAGWRFQSNDARQRYAWQRGLTDMRKQITEETTAKIVIGGKTDGFSGILPGVIEEAWLSLKFEKPLYLVGAFGGAARAMSDMLRGIHRPEFAIGASAPGIPNYKESVKLYEEFGGSFTDMETIGRELCTIGNDGLAAALNNGLSDDENAELMLCSDVPRVTTLVLQGLANLTTH